MAEKKQEISVPFCWEEVPGTPKKNWKIPTKTTTTTTTSINEPPIKLLPFPPAAKSTISIPFKWEEKPGTPLRFFSQAQQQSSSSSSYDEDETSPVSQFSDSDCYESGEALIEWLFPVLSKDSRYFDGGMNEGKVFDEKKYSVEIKRPLLTLGELMMMSQRRSYQKKIMDIHSLSFTKGTKKRKPFHCCINGLMDIILSKPHMNWNKQKQLKFM